MSDQPGVLYGIGLGPGDPELITLKGLRLLRAASTVFAPVARAGAPSYARQIAEPHLDLQRQEVVELLFPVGPDRAAWRDAWAAAARTVVERLSCGGVAAFITEGDPSLYSTFQYLRTAVRRLAPEVRVEVVPGVPSAFAAAALDGRPLALGDETFAIVPATRGRDAVRRALVEHDAVALLKVAPVLAEVLDTLAELGLSSNASWVRRAGRPEQSVIRDVGSLRGQRLDYFSLLLVRKSGSEGAE